MSVLQFPTGRTMPYQSVSEIRDAAASAYYAAERRLGVPPELAWERSEAFASLRFQLLENNIRAIVQGS